MPQQCFLLLLLLICCQRLEGTIKTPKKFALNRIAGRPLLTVSAENVMLVRAVSNFRRKIQDDNESQEEQYLVRTSMTYRKTVLEGLQRLSSFVQYIPHDTILIVSSRDNFEEIKALKGVSEIFLMPNLFKISGEIQRHIQPPRPHIGSTLRRAVKEERSETITLHILLGKDVPMDDMLKLCSSMLDEHKLCNMRKASGKKLTVDLEEAHKMEFILRAAHHPLVVWIEIKHSAETRNKFAAGLVQDSDWRNGTSRLIWDHGLLGDGEIIGISDTGVDYRSCFFQDDNVPLPYCKGEGFVNVTGCINYSHRKIVTYRYFDGTDVGDEYAGHGTHVCGSALGSLLGSSDQSLDTAPNGMAPNAKLAFDDLSAGSEKLLIPSDLNTMLFPHAYHAGARIHSLSWGCDCPGYDSLAMEVDQFMYDNPDFLVLIAAGNQGPYVFSVGSPATAKNALSVGASRQSFAGLLAYGKFVYTIVTILDGPLNSQGVGFILQPASFGPAISQGTNWNGIIVETSPSDACSPLEQISGKIALIERGNCAFTLKIYYAELAGAIAAIVSDNLPAEQPVQMTADSSGIRISIPSGMISLDDGDLLRELLVLGAVQVRFPEFEAIIDKNSSNELAGFSSQGPVLDSRIKPDVVCPGEYIHSALSQGNRTFNQSQCASVLEMSGTSMASPICAGSAALVRQYFRKGFYPSGKESAADAFEPISSLIKAMLIQSAQRIRVYSASSGWVIPPSIPDPSQGYGRVDVAQVLRFADVSSFNLSVWTLSISDGQHLDHPLTVDCPSQPLKITLVWTDPPAFPGSGRNLVNDLDLVLIDCDGNFFYGNSRTNSDGTLSSQSAVDTINNCEQVSILSPRAGCPYTVRVQAPDVPLSPQTYSLAVTGIFTVLDREGAVPSCPSNCSGHGVCNVGRCVCCLMYSGIDCSLPNHNMECNQSYQLTVSGLGWSYSLLHLPTSNWNWRLDIYWPKTVYPGFFIAYNRFPSQGDCDICLNTVAATILVNASFADSHYNDLDSLEISCGDPCVAESSFNVPNGSGIWVLGVTAYTAPGMVTQMQLTCYPPDPVLQQQYKQMIANATDTDPNSSIPASYAEVWLQIQTTMTAEEFTSTVNTLMQQAFAACTNVQPSQVSLGIERTATTSSQARILGNVQGRQLELERRRSSNLVRLDVVIDELEDITGAESIVARLTEQAINEQMSGAGLPGVQIVQNPRVVQPWATNILQPTPDDAASPFTPVALPCLVDAAGTVTLLPPDAVSSSNNGSGSILPQGGNGFSSGAVSSCAAGYSWLLSIPLIMLVSWK